jgi:hypothetical protein
MHGTAEYEFHYSKFPALAKYIDRVGATQVNFRRFIVWAEERKYPKAKAIITINKDREIKCDNSEYAFTPEEEAAINAELAKVEFPHSEHASWAHVDDLRRSGNITGTLYVFPDLSRKTVVMCQERIEKEDGSKLFIPWTMFMHAGGRPTWRKMEPDSDALPHWKPEENRQKASIMVHEGAKTAWFIDNLVNNPEPEWRELKKNHPWIKELELYEHWGASGGALGIGRSDLDEVRQYVKEGVVYYSCDHDTPGEQAAIKYSRKYGGEMIQFRYDERFPVGWDLADPVPEFKREDRVRLHTFAEPATWATRLAELPKPHYELSEVFARQWIYVAETDQFINLRFPRLIWTSSKFNSYCARFAHKGADLAALVERLSGSVEAVNYRPDLKTGRNTSDEGKKFFNIHRPRRWETYKKAPDVRPWLGFLEVLVPSERDRVTLQRWAATKIARPDIKMEIGLLLISGMQGVGKTTFCDILAEIIGHHNVAWVSEGDILGRFTQWREHELILCGEIYAGHSTAAYNSLKEVITDKTARIEKKFLAEYYIDNFAHVVACSNSRRALKLEDTDRRWFVPDVTELKQPTEWWVEFHHWLERQEGYRKIVWWAHDYLKTNQPIERGEAAPKSQAKDEVLDAFMTEEMAQMLSVLETLTEIYEAVRTDQDVKKLGLDIKPNSQLDRVVELARVGKPFVVFDVDIEETIKARVPSNRKEKTEKATDIRKHVKRKGFSIADKKHRMRLLGWRPRTAYAISSDEQTANAIAELLKGSKRNDATCELYGILSFTELALELLGPPVM